VNFFFISSVTCFSFISLVDNDATIRNITIYYPNQSATASTPVAYPWTISKEAAFANLCWCNQIIPKDSGVYGFGAKTGDQVDLTGKEGRKDELDVFHELHQC
jgi:hypothetical protein